MPNCDSIQPEKLLWGKHPAPPRDLTDEDGSLAEMGDLRPGAGGVRLPAGLLCEDPRQSNMEEGKVLEEPGE